MSSKVKRLKEVKFEILDLGGVKHVFRLNFRQIRKKLDSFFIASNRVEFERRKMPKSPKKRKSDLFGSSKRQNLDVFSRCQLEVLLTYSSISEIGRI